MVYQLGEDEGSVQLICRPKKSSAQGRHSRGHPEKRHECCKHWVLNAVLIRVVELVRQKNGA